VIIVHGVRGVRGVRGIRGGRGGRGVCVEGFVNDVFRSNGMGTWDK
jgi:hypothetical protein